MIVTFCGHRTIDKADEIRTRLTEITKQLIAEGADCFYFGGCGQFDLLALSVVREQQKQHPYIQCIYVQPYLSTKYCVSAYDGAIYPPIETVPGRYAISRRNEYMVDCADTIVAYVLSDFGGAYRTLCYAKRKNKRIINIGEQGTMQFYKRN